MGEVSANPSVMRDYFLDSCAQLARWGPEADRLREVLRDLCEALSEGNVPTEYRAGITELTADDLAGRCEQAGERVRRCDQYVYDVAEAVVEADGFDLDDLGATPVTLTGDPSWPDAVLSVPGSALDALGSPTDPSHLVPPLSLVVELEQNPGLWHELDQVTRDRLIEHHPDRVGSLDGLPTTVRHAANVLVLEREKAGLLSEQEQLQAEVDALLSDLGVEGISSLDELREQTHDLHHHLTENEYSELALLVNRLEEVDDQLQAIDGIEARINAPWVASNNGTHPDEIPPPAYLLGFGTEGIGQVILAVGDPDHADNVATYVPGTNTTLVGIGSNIGVIDTMWSAATGSAPADATSVILWFDYDAPQGGREPVAPGPAADAADPLRDFLSGLESSAVDDAANRTLIGYSYGSTVVGHTAARQPLAVDSIVFIGSPGVGGLHASDLTVDPDRVYATEASADLIGLLTPWFIHGPRPVDPFFGAQTFPSDPGGHNSYFEAGNVFFDNVAAVITGRHDQLEPEAAPEEPTPRPDEVSEPAPSDESDDAPTEPSDEPGPAPSPPGG